MVLFSEFYELYVSDRVHSHARSNWTWARARLDPW